MKREELWESLTKYLGEEDFKLFRQITKEELSLYVSKNIDYDESYYVKGTAESLKRFKVIYRAFAAKLGHPSHEQFMISDYVDALINNRGSEDNLIGREKDILFLYIHKNLVDVGKSELWITTKALDKVTNRKRNGYVTIILSERLCPSIENAKELKVITFNASLNSNSQKSENELPVSSVDSEYTCYN